LVQCGAMSGPIKQFVQPSQERRAPAG